MKLLHQSTAIPNSDDKGRYLDDAFLSLIHEFSVLLWNNQDYTKDPSFYQSIIELYKGIFRGDYGLFNSDLCLLCLQVSHIYAKNGDKKHANVYFDKARKHCISFDEEFNKGDNSSVHPWNFIYVNENLLREYK